MRRRDVTLTMLASAEGKAFTPVQIQKALFLLSRETGELFDDDSHYNFTPYDYGPFDSTVYTEIDSLVADGKAIVTNGHLRRFVATESGVKEGLDLLSGLTPNHRKFITDVSQFVHTLSFSELVTAIYRKYPEMKVNSVFVGD